MCKAHQAQLSSKLTGQDSISFFVCLLAIMINFSFWLFVKKQKKKTIFCGLISHNAPFSLKKAWTGHVTLWVASTHVLMHWKAFHATLAIYFLVGRSKKMTEWAQQNLLAIFERVFLKVFPCPVYHCWQNCGAWTAAWTKMSKREKPQPPRCEPQLMKPLLPAAVGCRCPHGVALAPTCRSMLGAKLITQSSRSSKIALQANNPSVLVSAWELAVAWAVPRAFALVISCITSALCGGPRPPVR